MTPSTGPVPPPPAPFWRLVAPVGLAASALLFLLGTALTFRTQLAAFLIAEALGDTGLKGVSLNVSRIGLDGLEVRNLTAEDGALAVAEIDVTYDLEGLFRRRLDAVTLAGATAALTWDGSGLRLGGFRPRQDSAPLNLPQIGTFRANDAILLVNTPGADYRAPLTITAEAVANGWNATVAGALEGPGVAVAANWAGVLVPADLSLSSGQGRFDISVESFLVPGSNRRLDAKGLVAIEAKDGVFALSVAKPLVFSASAPTNAQPSKAFDDLTAWSLTIAPSDSAAALVLTAVGEKREIRVDIAATGNAGAGRLRLAFGGEAERTPKSTQFRLARAHADLQGLPLAGGTVSGHVTVSNFAGDTTSATGHLDASLDAAGVHLAQTRIEEGRATVVSSLSLNDGVLKFDFETLQLLLSKGRFGDWILASPAELSLKTSDKSVQDLTLGSYGLSNSLDLALTLPEISFKNAIDENARIVGRAPDIRLAGVSKALSLNATVAASDLSFTHPAAEMKSGRFDLKAGGGTTSGTASARLVRVGPALKGAASASALVTNATLSTRGDALVVRGTFSTAAGAKLGEYAARFTPDFERGNATLTVPKTRFERGGKFDAADVAFLTPISDFTGTIGVEAERMWGSRRANESARVSLTDVGFTTGEVSVSGLTTTLELAALSPPLTLAGQELTVQSIAAGLPLSEIKAAYTFPGDGTLIVSEASANIAGGQIALAGAVLPLDERAGTFSLGVRKIDMALLAAQAKVDGLNVTGTLTGTIPLRSDATGYHFAEGVLRADAPGRLVYAPSSPSPALSQNQGGALLLQALSNFAYDRLSITLNGPVMEEISLLVAIAGKNPNLYGGYPIEFNLNLSGKLAQIVKQGFTGAGLPADLERQLRDGRPAGP